MLIDILASTLLGFLSALGIGGGSLLILWLTMVRGFAYPAAKYLNLLFFLPPAAIGCVMRRDHKRVPNTFVAVAATCSCAAAAFFSAISTSWDTTWVKRIFGILLIVSAIRELQFHTNKK